MSQTAHPETATAAIDAEPAAGRRVLVALDASERAERALSEALRIVGFAGGDITGIHAYAAKLHDRRFRQMEGGLPERYRQEQEMERQRVVHDDLITRGLEVISDSYHDSAAETCAAAEVPYRRLSPEGKNYRRIVEAVNGGDFDLLAIGALGLGAVPGALIGSVCERVIRRCPIDALVIRDAGRALGDGPLVVALDGSPRAFGALKMALQMGRALGAEVHAIAAYDPYFHTVAFNKISSVLSEEAGQTFRFKEQEALHEEIIDAGIAKIYQSHLDIATTIAAEDGAEITCTLLDGKPYQAICKYLQSVTASLLLIGKTGIHADADLDIGGNAENLLRVAPCHIWLSQATFTPPAEAVARETITWTEEAERSLERVPESPRQMVRMAIIRFAQESGHTVVTSGLIEEATKRFCPERGGGMEPDEALEWSAPATRLLEGVADSSLAATVRLRAEKRARRDDAAVVAEAHVRPFLEDDGVLSMTWTAAALARLAQVPEMVRGSAKRRIEVSARDAGVVEVTAAAVEQGLAESRRVMVQAMGAGGHRLGLDGDG